MSRLRAKCPDCRTYTAVALGPGYECHACGSEFAAGLIRVPRAWGDDGRAMVEAAMLPVPYPEVAVIEENSLREQALAVALDLPERPLVLGGCCCSHIGAVEGLAARHGRLSLVWLDAHGDLNTPESSPSGNEWGMPLRMLLDSGAVVPGDVALVGARNLDPPEEAFIAESGLRQGKDAVGDALARADVVYVALDCDALDPEEVASFMPEPNGLRLDEVQHLFASIASQGTVVGMGLSGLAPDEGNVAPLSRLCATLLGGT
jgi:arginase family enzyme